MIEYTAIRRGIWQGIFILALLLSFIVVNQSSAITPVLKTFTGFTLDFEEGRLVGWRQGPGTAFRNQPTLGDNPRFRGRGPANIQGRYWIGTYENYQGRRGQRRGGVQGDQPTGSLTSPLFTIPPAILTFRIGGGRSQRLGVLFYVMEGRGEFPQVLKFRATGQNSERMRTVRWDLRRYAGKKGYIMVVDNESGGWGHINVDDFRFNLVMPNVINKPYATAYRILRKYGFSKIRRLYVNSRIAQGRVAGTRPAPGALLVSDATVTVMVARQQLARMPDLRGQTLSAARNIIARLRLNLASISHRYSSRAPDTVISQSPQPGSGVRPGTRVALVLAQKYLQVPNVVGKPLDDAREIIAKSGLTTGEVSTVAVPGVAGIVIRQRPEPGTRAEARQKVSLVVSKQLVSRVPRLIGRDVSLAQRLLVSAGLKLGTSRKADADQQAGRIISQSIDPGSSVPRNTTIDIVVSRGEFVRVPNIVDRKISAARILLRQARLTGGVVEHRASERTPGLVLSQSPRAGQRVQVNSRVNMVVAVERDGLLLWIWLGVGTVLVAAGGYSGYRIIKARVRPAGGIGTLDIRPVTDMGEQHISADEDGVAGPAIEVRVIKDEGVQDIDSGDGLVSGKGDEHD
jgi:beta-lactam-binding protein with PASTA domain